MAPETVTPVTSLASPSVVTVKSVVVAVVEDVPVLGASSQSLASS